MTELAMQLAGSVVSPPDAAHPKELQPVSNKLAPSLLAASAGGAAGAGLIGMGLADGNQLMGLAGVMLMFFGLLVLLRLALALDRWMRDLANFATAVEGGDLGVRMTTGESRFAPMSARMNAMARSYSRLIERFSRSAQELASVAHESSSNAAGGDIGVREQRDVTVSAAASLEELTVSLRQASDQAGEVLNEAVLTGAVVESGAGKVQDLSLTVGALAGTVADTASTATSLGERSEEIGAIVAAIQDIASQTSLLALNAAIEAARAGEQGRAFAVVADEVRKLSENSSSAAGRITALVESIRQEITTMVEAMALTNQRAAASATAAGTTADSLMAMRDQMQQTIDRIRDIVAATVEQSTAADAIAGNIEQVAQLADRNETLVRDSSELSGYIGQLAAQLNTLLQTYRYE